MPQLTWDDWGKFFLFFFSSFFTVSMHIRISIRSRVVLSVHLPKKQWFRMAISGNWKSMVLWKWKFTNLIPFSWSQVGHRLVSLSVSWSASYSCLVIASSILVQFVFLCQPSLVNIFSIHAMHTWITKSCLLYFFLLSLNWVRSGLKN